MKNEEIYARLRELANTIPEFGETMQPIPDVPGVMAWLGRLHALLDLEKNHMEVAALDSAARTLGTLAKTGSVNTIILTLQKAISRAELLSPVTARGAFVLTGNAFDAVAAIGRVLESAKSEVLVVDPYLNERVLTDFAVMAGENVTIHLLAAADTVKPGLAPAAVAWRRQYGSIRPVTVRIAPARALHDRLIIVDQAEVWDLTQSIKDFAERTPATISKASDEISTMKNNAYSSIWAAAAIVV